MSLLKIREDRKELGGSLKRAPQTMVLVILLILVIVMIVYLGRYS